MAWYRHKQSMEQNRELRNKPHTYGQLTQDKEHNNNNNNNNNKIVFQQMVLVKLYSWTAMYRELN